MTKRNPILVVALTFVTFTVYAYYWLYRTTDELRSEGDREELSPVVDVVLAVLTFGLWGLWAGYRNAKITHELLEERGVRHTDRSLAVALFGAFSFVSGWSWLVSMALLQEDFNRLAESAEPYQAMRYEEAPARAPVQARVEVDQPAQPAHAPASRWEKAPSAPVFESNAPAPIVF